MVGWEDLLSQAKKAPTSYNIALIRKAYEFARKAHEGQFRLSGEAYITHPVNVALILMDLGMDIGSIVAGLLHDVLEDTKITKSTIISNFGEDIELLVDGVTKLGNVPLTTKREMQAENIRKMLFAMSKDVRVIIIKLADRLHNMRTAKAWSPQKRRNKSLETMEIYAPIAQRLGMRLVKEELEDIAIHYLDPIAYKEITDMLKQKEKANATSLNSESYIKYIEEVVYNKIKHAVKDVNISGRLKSHCGIYFKVYVNGKDWDEVFDIYAIRVIVETVSECYFVLGAMHDIFTPIPNRFKDYISTPKPNMYQSLHTTVIGPGGVSFEIQIRTKDMHYTAEYGIAAHWKYKQKVSGKGSLEEKLSWIRQIIETQKESGMAEDFVQLIKNGLGSEEVYVFTPKGEVKSLPLGSTIIDFAYSIHSEVGNKMIGAKVDGKMTQIENKIDMNQVIEIITTKSAAHGPSRRWLNIVKTSEARNKIRAWFKKECRDENIKHGFEYLKRELLRDGVSLTKNQFKKIVKVLAEKNNFKDISDFYAAIGYGGINISKLMPVVKNLYINCKEENTRKIIANDNKSNFNNNKEYVVDGIDRCLINFPKCCSPKAGDLVAGFITRGHGISIHKFECKNLFPIKGYDLDKLDRLVSVGFRGKPFGKYLIFLKLFSKSKSRVVSLVPSRLLDFNISINNLKANFLNNEKVSLVISIYIVHLRQLGALVRVIKKIPGVDDVKIDIQEN